MTTEQFLNEGLLWVLIGSLFFVFIFAFFRRKQRSKLQKKPPEALQQPREVVRPWEVSPATKEKVPVEVVPQERHWMERLRTGLARTQGTLVRGIDEFFLSKETKLSREQIFENLFELLIRADLGVHTAERLVDGVRLKLTSDDAGNAQAVKAILKEDILAILKGVECVSQGTIEAPQTQPHVVLMVGVNGVGKTTTTGKLAFKSSANGMKVAVGAADTFRAAAVEQLGVWAKRAGAEFVQLKEGADPASVAFEAVKVAKEKSAGLCLIDTAGRLHNRADLMQELAKIRRIVGKDVSGAPHEVLLVLDATTGQNAIQQAKAFREIVQVTGLVLTKLDGTAKGGVAIAIAETLKLPIRYIGVGESVEDLEVFQPEEFVNALFQE